MWSAFLGCAVNILVSRVLWELFIDEILSRNLPPWISSFTCVRLLGNHQLWRHINAAFKQNWSFVVCWNWRKGVEVISMSYYETVMYMRCMNDGIPANQRKVGYVYEMYERTGVTILFDFLTSSSTDLFYADWVDDFSTCAPTWLYFGGIPANQRKVGWLSRVIRHTLRSRFSVLHACIDKVVRKGMCHIWN